MALKSRKVFSAVHVFIIVLSLVSSPLAQTPRNLPEIRQTAAQEPQWTEALWTPTPHVADRFFETLGVQARLGRVFTAVDYGPDAPRVVILSHKLWRNRFEADPNVIGRVISLDGKAHTVVGVMPEGFYSVPDLWTPHWFNAEEKYNREEEKKAAEELEKKALALIDEVVDEAMSLSLARNRVNILAVAADILWERDEERARALVREAMDQAVANMREGKEKLRQEDGQRFDSRRPIRMVLDIVARRDAKLVLEFLSLIRSLQPEWQEEKGLEMELASQILESDPQTALRIADRHLDGELDYLVINFWSALLRKDPKAALTLTKRIIGDMKSRDILTSYDAPYVVSNVLNVLRSRANESAAARNNQDAADATRSDLAGIQQAYRDALEMVVAAALKVTSAQSQDFLQRDRSKDLLTLIQRFSPDIEKHLPSRAPAVRAKLAQFDKALYFQSAPQEPPVEDFENMVKNKSPDELISMAAAESRGEPRYWLYVGAVMKLTEQGDRARALQIAKDYLPDQKEWNPLFAEIKLEERAQAMKEGKLEEARKSILRLRSSEERALAWVELATRAEADKDHKSQRESLREAGKALGNQIETRSYVEAQLGLAAASLNLDPDRGFEILGLAIDRLNAVVSALGTITKFNQRELTPSDLDVKEECDGLDMELFPLIATNLDQRLLAFARKDFDRTVALLGRSQVNEFRLASYLMLLNRILGAESRGYVHSRSVYEYSISWSFGR